MELYTLCMPVSANWGRMLPFVPRLTSAQTLSCHAEIPTLHSSGSLRLIDLVKWSMVAAPDPHVRKMQKSK